jgi:hypothetical protein
MLTAIRLNVVMMNVAMLSAVILDVVMLGFIILSDVKVYVLMLSALAHHNRVTPRMLDKGGSVC